MKRYLAPLIFGALLCAIVVALMFLLEPRTPADTSPATGTTTEPLPGDSAALPPTDPGDDALILDTPVAGDPNQPGATACTMDVKQCPDGSYVGRVPPRCEFADCPGPLPADLQQI